MIPGTEITLLVPGTGFQFPVPTKILGAGAEKSRHVPGSSSFSQFVFTKVVRNIQS